MSRELPELILATLSAGPVGVGDALGQIDASNLRMAMRADSVLLKPDEPLEPIDASIIADAQSSGAPMIAATHSGDETEVFAYPRAGSRGQAIVSLRKLGIEGPAYEWDWVRHVGRPIPAGGSFAMVFQEGWAFAVVAPVRHDGIGVLGDTGKIVPLAGKRFSWVGDTANAHLMVTFAPGEEAVRLTGYAARRPIVRATQGSVGSVEYAEATHLFSLSVHPPATTGARNAELVIRPSTGM